ncbi:homeotic protein ocelliless isoform X3 [Anabas testudineus]|uniref:homeotic protein ocelliless isoform X3 n=1 Tax=Anabas testudineus TaxID=64144 RepID=UPI000E461646|nr:homeotic protein ocelliless isoform X3 [Anabas testudineus]
MLPPNLLIVSLAVFLATTVSTAPFGEKEQEEVEVEATEEGELSEEEEDDDDSKSQDKIEGVLGGQQTTTAAAAGGSDVSIAAGASSNIQELSISSSQSAGGGAHDGTAGSSAGSPGSAETEPSRVSADLSQPAGADRPVASSLTETNGSDGVDSASNGNGQKLLNGGGGGGQADSQAGVLDSLGNGFPHLDYTGECPGTNDPSSHDFLLGLMGGSDPFSPDVHISVPEISSGVTAAPYPDQSSSSSLDSRADPAQHVDQSQYSHGPGPSHSAVLAAGSSSSPPHNEVHRQQTDGADSPDAHGNGRQTHLTDTNAVTDQPVSVSHPHTDLTAGGAVTSLQIDLTASGVELSHDVTESSPVILHTDSIDSFTVSGVYTHTDLVTVATDLTGTDTDSTGNPVAYSHPAVTDHMQTAGPVTEQFNTSGQGPEGAENVELEDTC